MNDSSDLFRFEINGPQLTVEVATSVNKKGMYRIRRAEGVGGNPAGARGSDIHFRKLDTMAREFSTETGDKWETKDLVYLMDPREYYGRITDGTNEVIYQYITTAAPGSGQQYFFSPRISRKRIKMSSFHAPLAALMIKHNIGRDYEEIHWRDVNLIVDIIRSGVNPEMLDATLALMR